VVCWFKRIKVIGWISAKYLKLSLKKSLNYAKTRDGNEKISSLNPNTVKLDFFPSLPKRGCRKLVGFFGSEKA
jgi:hypothetical protein